MKKTTIAFIIATSLLTAASASAEQQMTNIMKTDGGIHLMVKFKNQKLHNALRATPETSEKLKQFSNDSEAQFFAEKHNVNASPIDAESALMPLAMTTGLELSHARSASLGYDEIFVKGQDVDAAVNTLMQTGQFASVEPVYIYHEASLGLNDPMVKDQFYMRSYGARFKSSSDFDVLHEKLNNQLGRKVRFAILDSGSLQHEDIEFADGYNFVSTGVEDGRGRGPDASAIYKKPDGTSCKSTHGLNVASIVAANRNNNVGIAGVFPSESAELVPVRVLGCAGGSSTDVMEGLLWAAGGDVTGVENISQRVDVANMSLGGTRTAGCTRYEQDIINDVVKRGVVIVTAAGNDNMSGSNFAPGACGNVINVGSVMNAGDKANFSNYGSSVDVVSEGNSVYVAEYSSDDQHSYANGSGTSFSAPMVAGLVGAMFAQDPSLNGQQIEARLKASALKNPSKSMNSNCRLYGCGAGLVQARTAMGFEQKVPTPAYSVQHRYEGFKTAADAAWMTSFQSKTEACQTLKYTMGNSGIERPGVSYKVFVSHNGAEAGLIKEVSIPQFIYATPDNATLSFQRCENGSCAEPIVMSKGSIATPAVCS